ncbi:MAG: DnaB-like helicase C-terminal domain-containing protein [Gallionellaceae bacterium]|nr:DnaB-like helicase C-terminal domain-containing protein [Gallionellaceae bacterium]
MNEHEQNALGSEAGLGEDGFTDMSQLIADAVDRIRMKKEAPEAITGISTCFPSLDYFTSGLQRGDLIVVAGRPCMGKRSFVCNIAMHVALSCKLPVAILENETGGIALTIRMLASIAKIDRHDLRTGRIGDDESERLESAVDVIKKAPIYFSSLTPLTVQELSEQLRGLNRRTGGLGLVVVDCLPELKLSGEKMNDDYAIKIAHTSRYIKALAKELDVPIVVFSPVERDLEERCNKRPVLTDLPGMAAIANAADLVLIVYREEVYDTESEEKGTAQIIISRNREGSIGSFSLKFDGRYGNFVETNY